MVKPTLQGIGALTIVVFAVGCGSSPTSPSAASPVASPPSLDSTPRSTLLARPGSQDFCEYPDLQVTASAVGATLDGQAAILGGSFTGVHRYGTMDGTVLVTVFKPIVLRNRQLELTQEHTFTLAEGTFTGATRSMIRSVSRQSGAYRLNERLPITGGTRLYLDAQGELRVDGIYDRNTGVMQYRVTGQVCRTGDLSID
jgi:hypothetical protein